MHVFRAIPSGTYEHRPVVIEEIDCPRCAERIKAKAKVCRFCGAELNTRARGRKRSERLLPHTPLIQHARGSELESIRHDMKILVWWFVWIPLGCVLLYLVLALLNHR